MTELTPLQVELCESSATGYSDLSALFINCTLKRSPEVSNGDLRAGDGGRHPRPRYVDLVG